MKESDDKLENAASLQPSKYAIRWFFVLLCIAVWLSVAVYFLS